MRGKRHSSYLRLIEIPRVAVRAEWQEDISLAVV
ncbi:protein of unknown function [Paraburkholderia kururiensis]